MSCPAVSDRLKRESMPSRAALRALCFVHGQREAARPTSYSDTRRRRTHALARAQPVRGWWISPYGLGLGRRCALVSRQRRRNARQPLATARGQHPRVDHNMVPSGRHQSRRPFPAQGHLELRRPRAPPERKRVRPDPDWPRERQRDRVQERLRLACRCQRIGCPSPHRLNRNRNRQGDPECMGKVERRKRVEWHRPLRGEEIANQNPLPPVLQEGGAPPNEFVHARQATTRHLRRLPGAVATPGRERRENP
jgi:hypothetical protein